MSWLVGVLKMWCCEGSISSELSNVSFSCGLRLLISTILWENVSLDLAVPAYQRKCAKSSG